MPTKHYTPWACQRGWQTGGQHTQKRPGIQQPPQPRAVLCEASHLTYIKDPFGYKDRSQA